MSDTVIKVENISKSYIISHQQKESYKSLRDVIARQAKSLAKNLIKPNNNSNFDTSKEEFWALKDVSFEIKQGDRVGVIGRNGAGKSTLLKVLSRITEPTKGRISIKGRVTSLLEVGTGFHPELTGRENIYLNGAILGMSKVEIKQKFDEIVAFAEVEKFLDTPVKRYSSGMYVRLAFSVAAHLEPEILIVDEVLAVGDAQFQKKCLGKMEEVGKGGSTVLFVSHSMGTITQLCTKAIYLISGQVADIGHVNSVVSKYLTTDANNSQVNLLEKPNLKLNNRKLFYRKAALVNQEGATSSDIDVRHCFYLLLEYEVTQEVKNVELSIRIDTSDGRPVLTTHQSDCDPDSCLNRQVGIHSLYIKIPAKLLVPGSYLLSIAAHEPMVEMYDLHEHVMSFTVLETGSRYAKYQQTSGHGQIGVVMVDLPWVKGSPQDFQLILE